MAHGTTIDTTAYRESGSVLVPGLVSQGGAQGLRADAWRVFRRQLERHGLIGPGAVSEAELTSALYTYFRDHTAEFVSCGKQIQHLVALHRLSLSDDVLAVVSQLGLDDPNISVRPVMFFNNPRLAKEEFYWKTPPHQDWRSMQGSLDSVVVWIALVDVDISLGALEVVPGSHRRGLLADRLVDGFGQTDEFSDEDFTAIEMRQGDALFFSSLLVHRSGTNETGAIRWSAQFRYNNLAETTFVARGYPHSFIYKPMEELITPDFPTASDLHRIFG
jgi:phytanoyl-CoA hydroxylase